MKGMPPGGMQQMLRQANQMQRKIEKLQEELKERTYSASSGGEAVTATVKGENHIESLQISDDLAQSEDKEMLIDLIRLACNEALQKAKKDHDEEMNKVTGGMGGMFGGLY